jgi:hypothetical protein
MRRSRLIASMLLAGTAGASVPCREADRLLKAGDCEGAIEYYRVCRSEKGPPDALWRIADCERQLGRCVDETRTLADLEAASDAPEPLREQARSRSEEIRRATALVVTSEPPGASVTVDGKPLGVLSVEGTPLSPGEHKVRLSLSDNAGGVSRKEMTVTIP